MIPPVVASDRGRAQTIVVATRRWGCRAAILHREDDRKWLESHAVEGESPVWEVGTGIADP